MCSYWSTRISYLVYPILLSSCSLDIVSVILTLYLGMFVRIMLCLFGAQSDNEASEWYDDLVLDFDWIDYCRLSERRAECGDSCE